MFTKKNISYLLYFVISILFSACTHHTTVRDSYLPKYQEGDYKEAQQHLQSYAEKIIPKDQFQKSGNAVWILLDRATIHFAAGELEEAIRNYELALQAIDYYRKDTVNEEIASFLLDDTALAYQGEDYEQILCRLYFALSLFQKGDANNAGALLRQAEDAQQILREKYRKNKATQDYQLVDNSLCKYLFALIMEKRGDYSNARILYKQAYQIEKIPQIAAAYKRLEKPENIDKNTASVIFVVHRGSAPYKISAVSPASTASFVALEVALGVGKVGTSWAALGGMPVPVYKDWSWNPPSPVTIQLDQRKKTSIPIFDVGKIARSQLKQKLPVIVARGVARYLMRRAAVGISQHQSNNFGNFMDLAMLVANVSTQADTRSWSTLPAYIDFVRFEVPEGEHTYSILGEKNQRHTIQVEAGKICCINIFCTRSNLYHHR